MSKKILFVEPSGVASNVFSYHSSLPLMGPVILGTILAKEGHQVQIVNENMSKITRQDLDADILAVSILTPTATRGYQVARMYRAVNPKGRIIMGGIHASILPEEALKHCDTVVTGEAEKIIADLVKYGSSEKIVAGSPLQNLDDAPLPDFTLVRGHEKMDIIPIMTSRGCPFHCEYCSVTKMFGHQYRTMSTERMAEAIKAAPGKYLFFYDDNINAQPKRTTEMMEKIIKDKLKIRWFAQARADIARDENLLERMYEAGCTRLFIGFESINPEALKQFNKRQEVEEIQKSIKTIHKKGIEIHGMFIFGSETDSAPIFRKTQKFCRKMKIDSAQFMILTPFPGTKVYDRILAQGRLLHTKWKYYDGMHAVFAPAKMKAVELQRGMLDTYRRFYSRTALIKDVLQIFLRKARSFVGSGFKVGRFPSFANLVVLHIGHMIVERWAKVNRGYIRYLGWWGKKTPAV